MNIQSSPYRIILISLLLMMPVLVVGQGTPWTVGPVSVTIPAGWTGKAIFPGERKRFFSPESTFDQYFALGFSELQSTSDDLLTHHNNIIQNLSGIIAPGTRPQSGRLGQFVWTRIVIQRPNGSAKPETLILYSTKVGSQYLGIDVDATSADFEARDLPAVEGMIRTAVITSANGGNGGTVGLDPARQPLPANSASLSGAGMNRAAMPTGLATLSEYVYSIPPGWSPKQYPGSMTLFSPVSSTGEQCQITMWPLRPASDNLMKDAVAGFQQAFNGFEPRSQTSYGPLDASVSHGITGAGWSYAIIKQGIGRHGPYEAMMGSVMAAKLNNAVAIVSTLSKDPLVSTCLGELVADAWPKFFYTLGFKSWVSPNDQSVALKQALAGTWTTASSTVADQFTFTANGRYGGASATQHYNLLANDTVLTTTQAFFGDGAYSINGNSITFTPDDRNRAPNSGLFRVEQESKDGGRTWTPILYLLRISSVDGKEYEVRYKKTGN